MIREIKKKMVVLSNRAPFNAGIRAYFADIERQEWLFRNMKIDGSGITENQLKNILQGNVCLDAPIGEYIKTYRLDELLKRLLGFAEMKRELDINLLDDIYRMISDCKEKKSYRKKNMTIRELDYTAPLPAEIPERVKSLAGVLIKASAADKLSEEFFESLVSIHNKIIEIFPYGEDDRLLARAAATYYMIEKGYPAVVPEIKEQEYNEAMALYLAQGSSERLKSAWQEAVLSRLEFMIQLTRY